ACDLVRQAALGLQCAAETGMVHRDIKPANILVQQGSDNPHSPWVAKVLDFGLARLHDTPGEPGQGAPGSRPHVILGTPDYLSPEQARSMDQVDIRSDLYSLGCTFYHLLTGQVPFPGGNTLDKLIRHGSAEPIPVEQLR